MLNQIPKQKSEESPWLKMNEKHLPRDYIKPIGSSLTYKLNHTNIRSKLDEKGASGVLIGFNPQLLYYKIINTKHVIFNNQKPIKIPNEQELTVSPASSPIIPTEPASNSPQSDQGVREIKVESDSEASDMESESSSANESSVKRNL